MFLTKQIFIRGGAGTYTLIKNNSIGGVQAPAITYDNTLSTMYFGAVLEWQFRW